MAIRRIRTVEDRVLRKKSKKVEKVDALLLQLLDDMAETMYTAPGIGLAAPQVGVSKRVIVVDVGDGLMKLINPKIVKSEGEVEDTEACLSVPGKVGDVTRFKTVTVKAMQPEGSIVKIEAEGLLARCLQHEIDHLDGILFIDKAKNIREPQRPGEGEEVPISENLQEEEAPVSPSGAVSQDPAISELRL